MRACVNALIGLHPFSTMLKIVTINFSLPCVNALIGLHPFSTTIVGFL